MKKLLYLFLCSVGFAALSQQADSIVTLSEVEIKSTSGALEQQLLTPASVSYLDTLELKRSTGLYLDDAINTNVPGVYMNRRTSSAGQQISIRGYGNGLGVRGVNGNFDSQGLKMYLNGIPITDAEGITVMDDIDFGSVDNVEIVKGPSGALYGLAIAGAINLQTQKAPTKKVSVGQDFMTGSYGLLRATTRVAIGGNKSSLLINYGRQEFTGYMPHTTSHKDFVNVIGEVAVSDKQSLTTFIGYSDSYDQRNGELTKEQYDTLDYSGNPKYIKNNAHSAVKSIRAGIGNTYRFTKSFSNSTSFFGSAQAIDQSSAGGWTDKNSVNYGLRSVFEKNIALSEKIALKGTAGLELQKMNALTAGFTMAADSTNLAGYNVITKINSDQATASYTASYFTQWSLLLPKGFAVTAGVGISSMNIRLDDRLWGVSNNHPNNAKLKSFQTNYGGLVAPTFSINKLIRKSASVYASYSTGYKAPVGSNILIATTGQVNTDLKPEKGTQFEIGTKGTLLNKHLTYTVAAFSTSFENKFTTVAVPNPSNTVTLYTYVVNGGNLNNNGLEVLVKYNIIKSENGPIKLLQPFVNLTYSAFTYGNFKYQRVGKTITNKDTAIVENYSGNAVAGVSPLVYNVGADLVTRIGFYGNATYSYKGEMYYTSDEVNKTKAYALLNAKVGFRKNVKSFSLDGYFGANNITGTQYYNMVFVNQMPDAYIPGPNEINFFGGLNVKYTF